MCLSGIALILLPIWVGGETSKPQFWGCGRLRSYSGSWTLPPASSLVHGNSTAVLVSHILHHDLHWMDVPQRVMFKLCMTVYKCLHGLALKYLAELCVPVADVAGRRQLRSASRGLLNFPRYNVSNYGRRAFCFAGPYMWNSLPEHIRQSTSIAVF